MSSLIESLEQQATEQRESDQEVYARLVREDEGKAGDVKRLRDAMDRLGKSVDDLRADQAILRRVATLEIEAAKATDELEDEVEAASDAYREYIAETERIAAARKAEAGQLWAAFSGLQAKQTKAFESRGLLNSLKRQHYALLGLPAPEPAPAPVAPIHFAAIPPRKDSSYLTKIDAPRRAANGAMVYGPITDSEPAAAAAAE